MTSRTLLTLVGLAAAACARQATLPVLLTPQSRFGLGEGFGPGIVAATARSMTFRLDAPAHVIVLRVTDAGAIEQVQPLRGGDPIIPRGVHSVTATGAVSATARDRIPPLASAVFGPGSLSCLPILDPNLRAKPDPACVGREAARAAALQETNSTTPSRAPDDEAGYWLLILSDAVTAPVELEARLQALELDDASLLATVRQLPGALVGGRTTNWSAYYLGFAVVPTAARNR